MTREEFIKGIEIINSAINSEDKRIVEETTLDTFWKIFNKYKASDFYKAIYKMLSKEDVSWGYPSPAKILKYLTIEDERYNKIFNAISKDVTIYTIKQKNKPKYKAHIEQAIKNIGGWDRLVAAENKGIIEEYRNLFILSLKEIEEQKLF